MLLSDIFGQIVTLNSKKNLAIYKNKVTYTYVH